MSKVKIEEIEEIIKKTKTNGIEGELLIVVTNEPVSLYGEPQALLNAIGLLTEKMAEQMVISGYPADELKKDFVAMISKAVDVGVLESDKTMPTNNLEMLRKLKEMLGDK